MCEKSSGTWRSVQWRYRLWHRVASDYFSDFLTSSKEKRRAGLLLEPLFSRFWSRFWLGYGSTTALAIASALSIAQAHAQQIDPCMRPEMNSRGAISYLNARVDKTDGPRSRVVGIQGLRSVPNPLIGGGSSVTCHGTLIMTDGTTETGILSVTDPGGAAPLEVSWVSDADRARPAASPPQVEAAAPHAAELSPKHTPEVTSSDNDPELLPEVISGVMEPLTDNVCPRWDSTNRAKEMIVYLTAAIKLYADSNRETLANSRNAPPEAVAAITRQIQEIEFHVRAMTACRDSIARKLNMNSAAVQQLYEYNTLTADETVMFNDLNNSYNGQPNYFSKLLAIPDQRRALHLIDLEIKELDFGIAQWLTSIDRDAGKPPDETDRELLARDRSFRKALVGVRTRIAKNSDGGASQGSGTSDTLVAPHAQDVKCGSPPYGDTVENYTDMMESFKRIQIPYDDPDSKMMRSLFADALVKACKVKIEHADRSEFHRIGIEDKIIDMLGTVALAGQYRVAISKQPGHQIPAPEYKFISVHQFAVDGPSLVSARTKVKLSGFYIRQGNVALLYADTQAVIMARFHPEVGTQPSVPLLIDHASHSVRENMVNCDSNPSSGQVGCQLTIRGSATMCSLNNSFGASRDTPCVNVEDGER